jgi:hypothetical protein
LLDGRNRLDAMERAGIKFKLEWKREYVCWMLEEMPNPNNELVDTVHSDPYEFVISANIHRRHLTVEQKRELIDKLLKADPTKSDRAIAKVVKANDKTVAKRRRKLEGRADIPHVKSRTDTKGRKQPAKKAAKVAPNEPQREPVPDCPACQGEGTLVFEQEGSDPERRPCPCSCNCSRLTKETATEIGRLALRLMNDPESARMVRLIVRGEDPTHGWRLLHYALDLKISEAATAFAPAGEAA